MKTVWLILLVTACCTPGGPTRAQTPAPSEDDAHADATRSAIVTRKLSMNLEDVPFHDALEMLTAQAGVGLTLDGRISAETLRQPLSLKLSRTSVYAVLHWIFRKHNLGWAVDGREIVVASPEFLDAGVRNRQIEFVEETEKEWKRGALPKLEATRMSVNVTEVPLERILRVAAEQAGMNLVWETDAQALRARPASLHITDAPVREILDKLATPAGLAWSLEAEAIVLSPAHP